MEIQVNLSDTVIIKYFSYLSVSPRTIIDSFVFCERLTIKGMFEQTHVFN